MLQVSLDPYEPSVDLCDQAAGLSHGADRSEDLSPAVLGLRILVHLGNLLGHALRSLEHLIGQAASELLIAFFGIGGRCLWLLISERLHGLSTRLFPTLGRLLNDRISEP